MGIVFNFFVSVCCHPICSERQTSCGRTSRGHTQEEGHTGFLHLPSAVLAVIFKGKALPTIG